MAAAVEELITSPQERQRLRLRGPEVASEYTMPRSNDAMEAALVAIAGGRTNAIAA
jgi:hypothetical protein